jgi:endoglucanase
LNEATGDTSAHFAELNKLNTIFVKALRDSGGFNADRVVTLVGPGEDSVKTAQNFVVPVNISNPWAIQFHYYSPYQLIFGAWGATAWGSDADKAVLDADFAAFRGNFSNVPIVLGEWEANMFVETSARWKYFGECINFHMK